MSNGKWWKWWINENESRCIKHKIDDIHDNQHKSHLFSFISLSPFSHHLLKISFSSLIRPQLDEFSEIVEENIMIYFSKSTIDNQCLDKVVNKIKQRPFLPIFTPFTHTFLSYLSPILSPIRSPLSPFIPLLFWSYRNLLQGVSSICAKFYILFS